MSCLTPAAPSRLVLTGFLLLFTVTYYAASGGGHAEAKVWRDAGQNTDELPSGHALLEEAAGVCGGGYIYTVRQGQYSEEQIKWLKTIIRFRFGDSKDDYPVQFQLHVEDPVMWDEMRVLLKNKKFSDWIGPRLTNSIRQLHQTRSALRAEAKILPHCRSDHCEEFFRHPTVKRYTLDDSNLGKSLEEKFKIVEIDNGADCN